MVLIINTFKKHKDIDKNINNKYRPIIINYQILLSFLLII